MKLLLALASALLMISCASTDKPVMTGTMKVTGCSGSACCAPAAACCDMPDGHKQ